MKYLLVLFFIVCSLDAHRVNLFVTEQNSTLDIYSYFASGAPCKNCKLRVKDQNTVLLDDRLGDDGKYFYTPSTNKLEITVDAGGGHIAKQSVEVKSIKEETLKEHVKHEKSNEIINIFAGLFGIFFIFLILYKLKKR